MHKSISTSGTAQASNLDLLERMTDALPERDDPYTVSLEIRNQLLECKIQRMQAKIDKMETLALFIADVAKGKGVKQHA